MEFRWPAKPKFVIYTAAVGPAPKFILFSRIFVLGNTTFAVSSPVVLHLSYLIMKDQGIGGFCRSLFQRNRRPSWLPCLSLSLLALLATGLPGRAAQIILPAGFVESRITGFLSPTAMAVAPDGRLFVGEHAGSIAVVKNGVRLSRAFLYVSVHQYAERGLVGVQVDPNFARNGYLYVYYPAKTPTIHFRLSRFTADGDVAVPGSEVALFDLPTLGASDWHNGGGIQFAPDGKLFLSVGENNQPNLSQSLSSVMGKILRLNPDGSIPQDNPFVSQTSGQNQAIWALGLRNPFSIAIQPGTGRLFANDVGSGAWEEIDEIVRGGNYGWPVREGAVGDNSPVYKDPFFAYPHPASAPRSSAITGGAFYNPARPNFPAQYFGKYFFADGNTQVLSVLDPNTRTATTFATIPLEAGVARTLPLYLTVAPDGVLHYVARNQKEVHSIRYVGAQAPQIGNAPDNLTVSVGDPARFTVEAFGTAPLTFQWQRKTPPALDFANLPEATTTTFQLAAATLADHNSQFRCVVANGAGTATSAAATLTVSGNLPPLATIVDPPFGTTFRAGDTIAFSGTGTDPEDGDLAPGAFTWAVEFLHLEHSHPFLPDTLGLTNGFFEIPKTGETSDQIGYRIFLTVTDAGGVAHTTSRDVLPVKSSLTLQTDPPGLQITLDERPLTAPVTHTTVVGMTRELGAADQVVGGIPHQFVSWSDGLPAFHTIDAPDVAATYTATFQPIFTVGDNAGLVSQVVPEHLLPGQTNVITVRMVNIGSTTWTAADNYFLGATNPPDNLTWGLNRVSLLNEVAPGAVATFTFEIVAPLTPGVYNLQWRMLREGAGFFGQPSGNVAVDVLPFGTKGNAAAFVSQNVPTLLAPGATALATITLRNVGTNDWAEATKHRLCSINPLDNGTWNLRRVYLGNVVPPGAVYTFTFAIRAPATAGNYNFQWMMVQETIERFAEITPNVVIQVSSAAPIAPTFTLSPADKTMLVGQTVALTAAASGAPTPTLQWQSKAAGAADFTDLPGATAGTYTTPVLSLANSGTRFRCLATNPAGSATSATATVTVTAVAPSFTLQPTNKVAGVGQTATVVAAAAGVPTPALQWQRQAPGAAVFVDLPGATTGTYLTPVLTLPDAGTQFRCVATNVAGAVTSAVVTVTVTAIGPSFTLQPAGKAVVAGQTVALTVTVAGAPTPALQWQSQAPGTVGFLDLPGASTGTYLSPPLLLADTGTQFRCVATNVAGSVTSLVAVVTVTNGSPGFTLQPGNKSVVAGQTATFTAAAAGTPAPTLQWQRQAPATAVFLDLPGATTGTYTTPVLALADHGTQFRCLATNTAGGATSTVATVTVTVTAAASGAPTVTRFFPASEARNVPLATLITATFSQAMNPATLTPTTFTLRRSDQGTNLRGTITYDPGTRTATLTPATPLKADWKYLVNLAGGPGGVTSLAGIPLVTTNVFFYSKDTQPAKITLVTASNVTATTATITWSTNEITDSQVRYGLTTAYALTSPLLPAKVRNHTINLTGLERGKVYNYQVRGTDAYGNVGASGNFTFTTLP